MRKHEYRLKKKTDGFEKEKREKEKGRMQMIGWNISVRTKSRECWDWITQNEVIELVETWEEKKEVWKSRLEGYK